ncbi:DNA (Cytosine-5)-methyltransferase DRM2 [Thalictrum thalictroides]|uniref:DNA (cytosine-5-)-methyltransferase n=1 Tax=Thalictrum thalictroides TaxID=46969 RepID=A0A7J6WGL1_THATH|nr:DNA (Cytosine-5)-methyltransferase DRM2 [Thalictrum thalictroides]
MEGNSDKEGSDGFCWDSDEEEDPRDIPALACLSPIVPVGEVGAGSGELSDGFHWDSEEEEEKVPKLSSSSCLNSRDCAGKAIVDPGEASSSAGPSNNKLISEFVVMGFSRERVIQAIEENGKANAEAILETLLTYSDKELVAVHYPLHTLNFFYGADALEESPPKRQHVVPDLSSSESAGDIFNEFSDVDSDLGTEENIDPLSGRENTLKLLVDMGYPIYEASMAMDRCGEDASIAEIADFICAAQMAKAADAHLPEPTFSSSGEEERKPNGICFAPPKNGKRKFFEEEERRRRKREKRFEKKVFDEDGGTLSLPKPMIGFGIPSEPRPIIRRTLPQAAVGPPYFYYENVALAPKGVWQTISSFLYEIMPEFVDSKFFSAAARKRGYVHNLPLENRTPLLPIPPQTIHEAFPLTKKFWPQWDGRTKLNCVQTCTASAKLTERIRKAIEDYDDEPPLKVQKWVIDECKKWNLVWVGRHKVAPLEPDEMESLLGFPKNHTRGGGICRTERLKGLGNSFQVDTVAYHLSVLKDMFPNGINVLSLFSGIGGAEVALYRLGIPLKNVVSVEISESSRNILRSWWESTNQKGNLIDINDVHLLDAGMLEKLINSIGGFDLIIGGSPCNNISGSNRVSRDGLEGKESSLFFDYFRILNQVKYIMGKS